METALLDLVTLKAVLIIRAVLAAFGCFEGFLLVFDFAEGVGRCLSRSDIDGPLLAGLSFFAFDVFLG